MADDTNLEPTNEPADEPADDAPAKSPLASKASSGSTAPSDSTAMPATSAKLDKKKTIIGAIVTIIVLAIVFAGIIPKFGNYGEAWASVQNMSPGWIIALGVSVIVCILVYPLAFTAAVPGLKYRPGFVIRQTVYAITSTVPAGGAVNLALQYAMLFSYGTSPAVATAGIAVTSVWSIFISMALPILGVVSLLFTGDVKASYVWIGLLGVAIIIVMVIVFWLILRSEKSAVKVGHICDRLARPVTKRMEKKGIVDVVDAHWLWITVSNFLVTFTQFLILYVAILAVGGTRASGFSIFAAFGAFAISRLATFIPATPGGLGTVDAALIGLLVAFGLDQNVALAADLVWRMASFVPQVLVGVCTGIWWRIREARKNKLAAA